MIADTCADLAWGSRAIVDLKLEEPVGIGVVLRLHDSCNAEIELYKVVESDLGFFSGCGCFGHLCALRW